mgnify:CR=1 FL=1
MRRAWGAFFRDWDVLICPAFAVPAQPHMLGLAPAEKFATIDAVRTGTLPILRSLSEADWAKEGRHTQSGPYNACDWLKSYGVHLTNHAKQIERNLAAYSAASGKK